MNVENDSHSGAGSFAINILAAFHSSDGPNNTTISCMVSEFLRQIPAGWVLRMTAQQQTRKINMTPAPPLRVKAVKESEITGKTVYQPQIQQMAQRAEAAGARVA